MSQRIDLKLDWCSYQAAKYAVEHWHYSRSLPTPPRVFVGAWEASAFIGCVVFSRGADQHIGKPFNLQQTEICELTRIALKVGHKAPVSQIASIAIRFLRQKNRGLRLVVSYADPTHGHHGGIYQAMNWIYLGQQKSTIEFLAPDGKQWHGRMVSATGRKLVYGQLRSVWRRDQCKVIQCEGKHKYILPLDDDMRQQIISLAKPYPKRGRSDTIDTAPDQGAEGGVIPTLPLHLVTA